MKGWVRILHANANKKKTSGVSILLSDKIDFKPKTVIKTKKDNI